MVVAYKSIGAVAVTTTTALSIPLPAVVSGDYAVMDIFVAGSATPPTITGWTLAYQDMSGDGRFIYWQYFGSSGSATNVSVTVASGGAYGKIVTATGGANSAPTVADNQVSGTPWASAALTFAAAALVVHFAFFNAVRTQGTIANSGTITSTNTSRSFDSLLSAYDLQVVTSAVATAGGGHVQGTYTGGSTLVDTVSVTIPDAVPVNSGALSASLPVVAAFLGGNSVTGAVPQVMGTVTGGRTSAGTVTITPTAGAAQWYAIVYGDFTGGVPTLPANWVNQGSTANLMVCTSYGSPGTGWVVAGTTLINIFGVDQVTTGDLSPGNALTVPGIASPRPTLLMRAFAGVVTSSPTVTYPTNATLGHQTNTLALAGGNYGVNLLAFSSELPGVFPGATFGVGATVGGALPSVSVSMTLMAAAYPITPPVIAGSGVVWSDEFNTGSLSPEWFPVYADGNAYNDSVENVYTPRSTNVITTGSALQLRAKRESYTVDGMSEAWTSARLISDTAFRYGRYEASIQVPPAGQGVWPSFWLLGTQRTGPREAAWPANGELDIMEMINTALTDYTTVHGATSSGTEWNSGSSSTPGGDLSSGYHTYWLEWSASQVQFGFDSTTVYTLAKSSVTSPNQWVFDNPMHIIFDIAMGGSWAGATDGTTPSTNDMYVDYVRVSDAEVYPAQLGALVNAGSLSALTPSVTASIVESATVAGALAASTPAVTASITGTQTNAAALSAHTQVPTAVIAASATNAGALIAATPVLTATVAGSQTDAGTLSAHTPVLTGSVTGTSTDAGMLTVHTPVLSTAITGTQVNAGSLSAHTPVLTAMLAESNVNRGSLAAVTPVLGVSVTGAQLNAGSVAGSTPLITASIADVVVNAFTNPRLATTTNGGASRVNRTNPSAGAPLDGGAYLVGTVNAVGLFPRLILTGVTGWNPGDVKTLSVYMMATAGTVLQLGGQFGGQTGTDYFATTFIATGSWQRVWMQITAPSVSTGSFTLWAGLADNTPIGVAFGISNAMLTAGPYLYPYEDGDSAGWSWSGTSGASVSQGPATPSNPAYTLPTLPKVTGSVAGSSINSAAVVATVPKMLGSVSGTQTNAGALLVRTPTVNATVSGQMIITAVLAATVPLILMYVTGIVPRNITVTAQLASRRWVGQIQPRNKTGSTRRRWAGNNG